MFNVYYRTEFQKIQRKKLIRVFHSIDIGFLILRLGLPTGPITKRGKQFFIGDLPEDIWRIRVKFDAKHEGYFVKLCDLRSFVRALDYIARKEKD